MNETMSGIILLYHTGFREIREPDVHFGRKNADFGQGFYMTAEKEFASRWATEQKGASAWMNSYEMDLSGLKIYRFERDASWYDYIRNNRAGKKDAEDGKGGIAFAMALRAGDSGGINPDVPFASRGGREDLSAAAFS